MKLLSGFLFFPLVTFVEEVANADVNLKGYYRSNGTYVQPYTRTSPNNFIYDNYSYPGNFNPNKGTFTPKTSPYGNKFSSRSGSSGYKSKPSCQDSSIVIAGIFGY